MVCVLCSNSHAFAILNSLYTRINNYTILKKTILVKLIYCSGSGENFGKKLVYFWPVVQIAPIAGADWGRGHIRQLTAPFICVIAN